MKTLGQIAFELWEKQNLTYLKWDELNALAKQEWEDIARGIRNAPEPAAPTPIPVMRDNGPKTLGQIAFEAYYLALGKPPIADWKDIPIARVAWEAAAKAAREAPEPKTPGQAAYEAYKGPDVHIYTWDLLRDDAKAKWEAIAAAAREVP